MEHTSRCLIVIHKLEFLKTNLFMIWQGGDRGRGRREPQADSLFSVAPNAGIMRSRPEVKSRVKHSTGPPRCPHKLEFKEKKPVIFTKVTKKAELLSLVELLSFQFSRMNQNKQSSLRLISIWCICQV